MTSKFAPKGVYGVNQLIDQIQRTATDMEFAYFVTRFSDGHVCHVATHCLLDSIQTRDVAWTIPCTTTCG